jgi:hypothetical protein
VSLDSYDDDDDDDDCNANDINVSISSRSGVSDGNDNLDFKSVESEISSTIAVAAVAVVENENDEIVSIPIDMTSIENENIDIVSSRCGEEKYDDEQDTTTIINQESKIINIIAPSGKLGIVLVNSVEDESSTINKAAQLPPLTSNNNHAGAVIYNVNNDGPLVNKVMPDDRIIAIDDENVSSMSAEYVSKLLYSKNSNTTRKISILRASSTHDNIVTTADDRNEEVNKNVVDSNNNNTNNINNNDVSTILPLLSTDDHAFNIGQHVRVSVVGHKKYGMIGIVEKRTKCYIYFRNEHDTIIKISPKFLEHINFIPSTNNDDVLMTTNEVIIPIQVVNDTSSTTAEQANNVAKSNNHDFIIGEHVTVVQRGHTKFGSRGIIQKKTKCFIFFTDDSTQSIIKISPKFLQYSDSYSNESIATASQGSTSSNEHERQMLPVGKINGGRVCEELKGLSALLGFGSRIKMIVLGGPNEITNAISFFWGLDACLAVEMPLKSKDTNNLPIQKIIHDKVYELYYAEVGEDKSSGYTYSKPKKVTAYYVCSDNLREEEEKLADFGALSPSKIWARRKHYISAAIKNKKKEYAVYPITANDVTMIDDVGTVGCGFISEEYLEDILGNNAEAKRALGIQVRIFIPTMGVFKGMLMRKANIVGIQVNLSLRKIGPSRHSEASDDGCIVIKRTFPSCDNFSIGRKFNLTPPSKRLKPIYELKEFKKNLKEGKSCKISPMYERLLKGLGVSDLTLKQYSQDYKNDPDKLCHTHLIGMADPTNKLPSNTVFVTGMSGVEVDEIFVTRSPCMEAEDGRVIKVVKTKPDDMENTEWKFLQSLTFGALIFGNPRPGDRAMPELIAGGDLDGDLYFVCWDKAIVDELHPIPITHDELVQTVEEVREAQYNQDWFINGQTYISKVPTHHIDIDQLVCDFYKKAIEVSDMQNPDAVSYSRAFKQALEVKKHGDRIFLPQHLWKDVPETSHHYLTADTGI